MLLAGDLGGTNCRFALFDHELKIVKSQLYRCRDYDNFETAVRNFVNQHSFPIEAACFGLPGPVVDRRCKLTNLDWSIVEASTIEEAIGVKTFLLNDVEANAYGLETLREDEIFSLKTGHRESNGNRVIVALGTSIGEAALINVDGKIHAIASEGGHTDFGPFDELQWELLRYVQQEYKRVSYEVILGGHGLIRIYNYLVWSGYGQTPDWLAQKISEGDAAAAISQAGMTGQCQVCEKALDVFISIFAAEAGNAAVKFLARGGIYLGGGIPPRILNKLRQPLFLDNFVNKDKISHFLEEIPIDVILNEQAALQGAAWYALRQI